MHSPALCGENMTFWHDILQLCNMPWWHGSNMQHCVMTWEKIVMLTQPW